MKFAIPVVNGKLCTHFGHCEAFAIIDADPQTRTAGPVTELTPPPHEPGVLPQWLGELGVETIIAGGMGQRARNLFSQRGITVVTGAPAMTPHQAVGAYLEGSLVTGDNPCDH